MRGCIRIEKVRGIFRYDQTLRDTAQRKMLNFLFFRVFVVHLCKIRFHIVPRNTFFVKNGLQLVATHFHFQTSAFDIGNEAR